MIETERLIVRPWRDSDREPFAVMGCDPDVMAHLGPLLSRAESNAAIDRMIEVQAERGHCFWAVERRDDAAFLGFCGLKIAPHGIPALEGAIEIGWRLQRGAWGFGYAREAAAASLDWGFTNLRDDRIIAMTTTANIRSWGLMERLGMVRRCDLDFAHPDLATDDPLSAHIIYEGLRP